ncbi:hypothetical protein [Micromonospora sp. NPDC048887]|uniref:helix-turn-helix domain-containing protein n=1 Tax=Micromonospora sp. NPDC048887 TaxID=3155614 RepID=UPI00340712F7
MGATWDAEGFRRYVLTRAKELGTETPSHIARLAGVNHGMMSKWLNGQERPSSQSATKLAKALQVPEIDLLVLAGHATRDTTDPTVPLQSRPEPHTERQLDPLLTRLATLLGEGSPISPVEQAMIRTVIERMIAPYPTRVPRARRS